MIRYQPNLDPEIKTGLPVWRVPTLLVAMSHLPPNYRDWPNVSDRLTQATTRATEDDLRTGLTDEPRSIWMRLTYLLDRGGQVALARRIESSAPRGHGPYYLGSRKRRGHHNSRYDVIDSVLE
ncbi:MAG: hypothetical protein GY929_20230 [Actinomycetia bacterium]|nr:hypothetical protein [Actinomycetes bacterium]